jgi:tRNA(Arg) A34 adenosine deaminase TadA
MNMQTTEDAYMRLAIQSAEEGIEAREGGPFGACIVRASDHTILAIAHNTVLRDHDPTCHAEMNAIRMAAQALGHHDLSDCVLYTTAEPCPMCLGAIYWANISQVYMGVTRECAAKFGFRDERMYTEMHQDLTKRQLPCQTGVLAARCESVFTRWTLLEGPLY